MTDNFIQLKGNNLIKVGIKDKDGKDSGKYLQFDLEDIEMPLRYQEMMELHKKNENNMKHQLMIINKREDYKGKKLFTRNEEDSFKVIKEFYKKDMEALDMFLGEGKTQMILDIMERKPYITMFDDIGEALTPLIPIFEKNLEVTENIIKNKYKIKEDNTLEL